MLLKTWESVSPEHWDMCRYNGEIYLMPEDNYAQWTNHGFIYRLDWAKAAGLDKVDSWGRYDRILPLCKKKLILT